MKLMGSSSSSSMTPLLLLSSIVVAVVMTEMPVASAFAPHSSPSAIKASRVQSTLSKSQRKRRTSSSSLASNQRRGGGDPEDQILSIRNSWKTSADSDATTVVRSEVPSDENNHHNGILDLESQIPDLAKEFKDRFLKLPPPPEDQFIMTGDIALLFLYAFTSHSINDSVVKGLLNDPKMTIPEAVKELDPMHDMVSLHAPVWVDMSSNPNIPFGNPAVDRALEVSARDAFLNHWGALFSTEGSACVALCTCWLIAGWFHRAFLYDNSTYCNSDRALTKTVETWMTSALLLAALATGADWLVGHVPALQSLFCVTCKSATNAGMGEWKAAMTSTSLPTISFLSLTQSDVLFIVDSLTVLIAWRWSAHRILNTFR